MPGEDVGFGVGCSDVVLGESCSGAGGCEASCVGDEGCGPERFDSDEVGACGSWCEFGHESFAALQDGLEVIERRGEFCERGRGGCFDFA